MWICKECNNEMLNVYAYCGYCGESSATACSPRQENLPGESPGSTQEGGNPPGCEGCAAMGETLDAIEKYARKVWRDGECGATRDVGRNVLQILIHPRLAPDLQD